MKIMKRNHKKNLSRLYENAHLRGLYAKLNEDKEIDSEDADDVTITLTPSDVAILRKVLTKADACATFKPEDDDEGEAETCPGCDDPNCPDCNPNDTEELPVGDAAGEFEVPDVSEIEDTSDEGDINYFS